MNEVTTAEKLPPAPPVDKRAQVETLLAEMLQRMEYPAKLELKELADGSLGVAMNFEGELPGITPGKRSHLVDCLQFLINKCINRPGTEKKWVTLGVNGFPEPRQARPPGQPAPGPGQIAMPAAPLAAVPPAGRPSAPPRPSAGPGQPKGQPRPPHQKPERHEKHAQEKPQHARRDEGDERTLEVPPDPLLTEAGKALAEKAAKLGRIYAVMAPRPEDRARLLQCATGVQGMRARVEGEGHWRRVTFVPDKPVELPKKSHLMPDYDEEE